MSETKDIGLGHLLLNLSIARALKVEDYFQLYLSDGSILNLYNQTVLNGVQWEDLTDKSITRVDESADVITLTFSDGSSLSIITTDEGYNGPEAFSLHLPNGDVIVER